MTMANRRMIAWACLVLGAALLGYAGIGYARAAWWRYHGVAAASLAESPHTGRPAHGAVIATLAIPRLGTCDPVLEGDDPGVLSKGIGHLPDTALPWETGNAALAGHRDTVFRPLARIRGGDLISVTTAHGRYDYRVTETRIVAPDDVSVLEDRGQPMLTLITCYPFRLIGRAPKRFVVRADRVSVASAGRPDCTRGAVAPSA